MFIMNEIREKIERKAYQHYIERGCRDGQALEDWLRAEREVLAEDVKKDQKKNSKKK
jgi:hypothetical protein